MSPARPGDKSKACSTQGPAPDYPQNEKKSLFSPDEGPCQAGCSPGTATLLLSAAFDSPGNSLEQDRKIQCKIQSQCRTGKKARSLHTVISWFRKTQDSCKSTVLVFPIYPTGPGCLHKDKFQLDEEQFSLAGT